MPPRKPPTGPVPVSSFGHDDKRVNIPTADSEELMTEEAARVDQWYAKRDPSLDPQLVWKGKDEQDAGDLVVDAPPIYIQEKIAPQVIIENLRRANSQEQLDLFGDFDGLSGYDAVEYYRHEANWSNRMILGDSLQVMASLAEKENLRGKAQMIYVDPPYGIKFGSNWQAMTDKRDVSDGKIADTTREVEQIKAFRDTWELGIHSYLAYLRDRLTIARDLLTESGSVFVQIGDENVHLVRSLLDEVFGSENLVSQIVTRKTTAMAATLLGGTVDYVLWYARDRSQAKYRTLYTARSDVAEARYDQIMLVDGTCRAATADERTHPNLRPNGARLYRVDNLTNQRPIGHGDVKSFTFKGRTYTPATGKFKTDLKGLQALAIAGRIHVTSGGAFGYMRFADDFGMGSVTNLWSDISGAVQSRSDPKIYVVQSSTSLVERCIQMTTDPGDLILDPTCGSGTVPSLPSSGGGGGSP